MMGGSEFKVPMLPNKMALVSTGGENKSEPQRCSNLKAPIMLLTGHEEEIFAARFSTDGTCLATAGFDQKIFLWNVYGDCENFSVIRGHTGAIMDVHFNTDSSLLVSAATDKTVRV
ncbi:U5 small nuclear ribonucleoprotein 40 kDa protein, partial [Trichostrongylus colubriformis]